MDEEKVQEMIEARFQELVDMLSVFIEQHNTEIEERLQKLEEQIEEVRKEKVAQKFVSRRLF